MGERGLGDACGFQGTLRFPSLNGFQGGQLPSTATRGLSEMETGVQMLLVAIKWARRDDPVVLKRKKKKKNAAKSIAYPGWFGKKLLQNLGGKRERGKGTKERQINKGG